MSNFFFKFQGLVVSESTASLLTEAQMLHLEAIAGNQLAVNEIETGLTLEAEWEYAGIIFKNDDGTYKVRDSKEKLTSSGPIPLAGIIYGFPPKVRT